MVEKDGASSTPRVLVADDDASTRVLIRAALESDGWTVEEAADGVRACESVERVQPDVVVMDVSMPNLDGFEACVRLRGVGSGSPVQAPGPGVHSHGQRRCGLVSSGRIREPIPSDPFLALLDRQTGCERPRSTR